jgi:hypothetical protein
MQAELRNRLNLPSMRDLSEFSRHLGLDYGVVKGLLDSGEHAYRVYKIPKKSGSTRQIEAPNFKLKAIQSWILRNILDLFKPHQCSTAFRPSISILENANRHRQNRYAFVVDIKNFFPSVGMNRVKKVFRMMGYNEDVVDILARFCCFGGRLPQGGVCSPSIANLACTAMDTRLSGFSSKHAFVLTRYADDIVVSSNNPGLLRAKTTVICKIICAEGFELNRKKISFLGPDSRFEITGLVKDCSEPRFGIGRVRYRQIRSLMHHIVNNNSLHGKYEQKVQVDGLLNFVKSVDILAFAKLKKYAVKIGYDSNIFEDLI